MSISRLNQVHGYLSRVRTSLEPLAYGALGFPVEQKILLIGDGVLVGERKTHERTPISGIVMNVEIITKPPQIRMLKPGGKGIQ